MKKRFGKASAVFTAAAAFAGATAVALVTVASAGNTPVSGAAFTTVNETADGPDTCANGNPDINCNIYGAPEYVWLSGGPSVAYVGDGDYFFAVLEPGGQSGPNDGSDENLSDDFDEYTNRTFTVTGGTVSYSGSHVFDSNKIRLSPYGPTTNPGGVYILAICSLADGYPVDASDCKYDAFKVGGELVPFAPLAITKSADGNFNRTYDWTVEKNVEGTGVVKQVGGMATFTYAVSVEHDAGTVSDVKVTGIIEVTNPNIDSSTNPVALDITSVTDRLGDDTECSVTGGDAQTLIGASKTFAYECTLSGLPSAPLSNTATVNWPAQVLSNGSVAEAGQATFTFPSISFDETVINSCKTVSDTFNGGPAVDLGTVCIGDPNPTVLTYSNQVTVPKFDCVEAANIVSLSADAPGVVDSSTETVTVCGPVRTGALTMGFWQNKNGQGIITGGSATAGVCNTGAWLRQYLPFQDLSAAASCGQVATYATTIIESANAGGAAMNAMLKAQMLATSLDVYFSDPMLGGNKIGAPAPVGGVSIDLTKVCKNIGTCSIYENTSAAFGDAASMTVTQLLTYAASQSNSGGSTWYGQVKATQELAKDTFDAINNQVAFKA